MRAVIQRVKNASVSSKKASAKIGKGFLVLIAATHQDTKDDAYYLAEKIGNLRIMADSQGKMNSTLTDTKGEMLVISQFTLYSRTRKGNRPSFIDAAQPEKAKVLYDEFLKKISEFRFTIKTGIFGEYMLVSLTNDGPVTIIIDSSERNKPRS
jgi:D-tyrosyl-tRNA(Tyr) deacylase